MAAPEVIERYNPAKPFPVITYNIPYYEALAKHLTDSVGGARPFIIISGSLSRDTDAVQRLTDSIGQDRIVGFHYGMKPHTFYSEVLEIMREIRQAGADSIITVGGGSLVDGVKAIALALANDADTHEKLDHLLITSNDLRRKELTIDNPIVKPSVIPYMCVTTTLSAGEFNPFGGATNDVTMHKQLFADPTQIGHRVIAIDPKISLTTPERVWLSTGLRAMDHCVESICSSKPTPEGTACAINGLKLLIPSLLRTKRDPQDLEARLNAQLGAAESMKPHVIHGVPVGASHGIGHQVGPYGVPHAETTCVCLPAVQKFNAKANADRQAIVLDLFWGEPAITEVLKKHALAKDSADLGDALDAIIRELEFPRTLKAYGIGRDKLDVIAESSLKDALCQLNVIPLVQKDQVLEILEMCVGDD
ncbi:putative Fe-containing alcohol dehydrogenase [Thozetella sp. PMI_491]|nr:putative Fe-containing alcohol dehydrogenase [Thozetella sp. PMI_491]